MMSVEISELAERFPSIAAHLDQAERGALLAALEPLDVDDGVAFIEEGTVGDSLYLLRDGRAAVSIADDGRVTVLGVLPPGAMLGEVALMEPGPSTATVRASGRLRLLRLRRAALERLAETNPRVAAAILHAVCATVSRRIGAIDERCNEILRQTDPQESLVGEEPHHGLLDYFRLLFHRHGRS